MRNTLNRATASFDFIWKRKKKRKKKEKKKGNTHVRILFFSKLNYSKKLSQMYPNKMVISNMKSQSFLGYQKKTRLFPALSFSRKVGISAKENSRSLLAF